MNPIVHRVREACACHLRRGIVACLCLAQIAPMGLAHASTDAPTALSGASSAVASAAMPAVAALPAGSPAADGSAPRPGGARAGRMKSQWPEADEFISPTEIGPDLRLSAGKTTLIRLTEDAARLSVGNPGVADVLLLNPREIYVLGKGAGTTNLFIWARSGRTTILDVAVGVDVGSLRTKLAEWVPGESEISVDALADTLVLGGRVSDAVKAQRLVQLAEVFSGKKIVNLLRVDGSQQVMLEVKVAEVSRSFLDKLGFEFNALRGGNNPAFVMLSRFLSGGGGRLSATTPGTSALLDAEVKKGLVKVLAEPTIMAISGQEGAFLAGGKIFIPVPTSSALGLTNIALQEKEFGVGVRFTPTVLEDGLINLQVTSEVSELSQLGVAVSTGTGQTSVLPSITTRRAATTVQLRDGETFAIGGLVKNNVTEAIKAFPGIGEIPVLGALFRSTEFQTDRSELMFIITPRLVRPVRNALALPTDHFIEPTRRERMLGGQLEGSAPAAAAAAADDGASQAVDAGVLQP